jgi:hypothetical protein
MRAHDTPLLNLPDAGRDLTRRPRAAPRPRWPAMLALLCVAGNAGANLRFHYEGEFDAEERAELAAWITEVVAEIERFIAPYPFDVDVRFHPARNASSPVPWANTRRSRGQGVNIHVNPAYSRAQLLADWTAWHEFSHLLLPYLGRRHAWFAEGFASYMQYQAMQAAGILTPAEAGARYAERIGRAAAAFDLPDLTFVEAAPILRSRRDYPTLYWGGAAFFLAVENELEARGTRLADVLRTFVRCCRTSTEGLDELVATLDEIAGVEVLHRQLEVIRRRPGFPDVPAPGILP